MTDKITEHFREYEFRCKCCGKVDISRILVNRLEVARGLYGKPMIVTSGYRCPRHNEAVGGVKDSYHTQGLAADILCRSSADRLKLVYALMMAGFSRIGVYRKGFVHVGVGLEPAIAMWVE